MLLSRGAEVYIATCPEERARSTIDGLKQDTGKDTIFFLKLDVLDLLSIKTAAEEFISNESDLHAPYNNA